ncbi:hypothetical protein GL263_09455 [Streptomyces durbertensis]|uniref:Uncharacterized protein n=1 Tax=Streptomyces durbertensis TaxID=2448886 RepID=A0ABR6EEM6_9ACTN|nr:hypothetical protein [Streptomyces durbertensis]MBB1243783.1 hypothetical protein [Streptomyces durbertensis]
MSPRRRLVLARGGWPVGGRPDHDRALDGDASPLVRPYVAVDPSPSPPRWVSLSGGPRGPWVLASEVGR